MNNRIFGVSPNWATIALGHIFCSVNKRESGRGRISVAGVGVVAFFSRHHQSWVIVNHKEMKEFVDLANGVANEVVNRSDSSAGGLWMILELSEVSFIVHKQRRRLEKAAKKAKRSVAKHSLLTVGLEEDFVEELCKIKDDKLAYLAMLAFEDAARLLRRPDQLNDTSEENSFLCLTAGRLNSFGLDYLAALLAVIRNIPNRNLNTHSDVVASLQAYGLGKLQDYAYSAKDFSDMMSALDLLLYYFSSQGNGKVIELEE